MNDEDFEALLIHALDEDRGRDDIWRRLCAGELRPEQLRELRDLGSKEEVERKLELFAPMTERARRDTLGMLLDRFYSVSTPSEHGEDPAGARGGDPAGAPSGDPAGAPSGDPVDARGGDPAGERGGDPVGAPSGDPAGARGGDPAVAPSRDPAGARGGDPAGARGGDPAGTPSVEPAGSSAEVSAKVGVTERFVDRISSPVKAANDEPEAEHAPAAASWRPPTEDARSVDPEILGHRVPEGVSHGPSHRHGFFAAMALAAAVLLAWFFSRSDVGEPEVMPEFRPEFSNATMGSIRTLPDPKRADDRCDVTYRSDQQLSVHLRPTRSVTDELAVALSVRPESGPAWWLTPNRPTLSARGNLTIEQPLDELDLAPGTWTFTFYVTRHGQQHDLAALLGLEPGVHPGIAVVQSTVCISK